MRKSTFTSRHRSVLGALGVLAVIGLFTAPVWFSGRVYFLQELGVSDLMQLNVPLRAALYEALAGGRLPFWTTRIFGGWPSIAELQIGAFFPPFWLGPWSEPARATSLSVVLLMCVAGLATYRLARALSLSPFPALVAAASWPLSGQWLSNVVHPNMLGAVALAPLAFAYLEESMRRGRSGRLLWLAPVMAFSFFAGHPHMVYLTSLALAVLLLVRRLPGWGPAARPGMRHLAWLCGTALVTLLLVGPQLLPALELTALSQRAHGVAAADASIGALSLRMLGRWIHPWIDGDVSELGTAFPAEGAFIWTHAGWLAPVALVLALLDLRRDRKLLRPLILVLASVLVAMGPNSPFFELLRLVPGFRLFRFPSRALFFAELILALLTGWLVQRGLSARAPLARRATVLLAVLHLAWLFAIGRGAVPTLPAAAYPGTNPIAAFLAGAPEGRFCPLFYHEAWIEAYVRAGGWRGDLTPYLHYQAALSHDAALLHRLASTSGYAELMPPGTYAYWLSFDRGPADVEHRPTRLPGELIRAIRASAARYVVSVRPLTNPELTEVFRTAFAWEGFQVRVFELADPLPRVRVVGGGVPAGSPGQDMAWLTGHDSGHETVIEGLTAPEGRPGRAGQARVADEGPTHLAIQVEADRPAFLVVADTYYPGWRAWLDGSEVPIQRADVAYRGVRLPAGRHGVVMAYDPVPHRAGTWAMAAGLVLFFGLVAARGRSAIMRPISR